MQVVEIDDRLATRIAEFARSANTSITEFVNDSLREVVERRRNEETDAEKIKRFAESYEKHPQSPDEYEIWQDEQVWEDE